MFKTSISVDIGSAAKGGPPYCANNTQGGWLGCAVKIWKHMRNICLVNKHSGDDNKPDQYLLQSFHPLTSRHNMTFITLPTRPL